MKTIKLLCNPRTLRRRGNRRGAMLVFIALTLPLILAMAAFAIDLAWMQLIRTELRIATDAASRAGTKALSSYQTKDAARATAKEAGALNSVAGEPLLIQDSEIEIGLGQQVSQGSRFTFIAGGTPANSMRVTGSRTGASLGGPAPLFLGQLLGATQFEPTQIATSAQLDRDICMVVDRSGSMTIMLDGSLPPDLCDPPHPVHSRWGALRQAVSGFVDELQHTDEIEQCALVSYSSATVKCKHTYNTSDIDADLDSNYGLIHSGMNRFINKPVRGGTNISAGIDDGIAVLTGAKARPFALKTMVVMTDGHHNMGPEPVLSAQRAAEDDITIHTVTFGGDAEVARMQDVANATGGNHYHAPDAAALVQIFREIAATLPVVITE